MLELLESMLDGKRDFDGMHSITDDAAFKLCANVLYPDPYYNYFANVRPNFLLCLHPSLKGIAEARDNPALMKHLWFGFQWDPVARLTAAMVGKLLDEPQDHPTSSHKPPAVSVIFATNQSDDKHAVARRVKHDIGFLAQLWNDDSESIRIFSPATGQWTVSKKASKRPRDPEWFDVSQLVQCGVPMSFDARFRPMDTILELSSITGAHDTYTIDLTRLILHPVD